MKNKDNPYLILMNEFIAKKRKIILGSRDWFETGAHKFKTSINASNIHDVLKV